MQLTPLVKNFLIANVVMFMLQLLTDDFVTLYGSLFDVRSDYFMPHQAITYMFLHGGMMHLVYNMLILFFFGPLLEQVLGDRRFFLFYMICGLGAGMVELLSIYLQYPNTVMNYPILGASGAMAGIMMAVAVLFPNLKVYIYFLFPVKIKYLVAIYLAYEMFNGLSMADTGIAHFAHLGGMLFGFLMVKIWKLDQNNFY